MRLIFDSDPRIARAASCALMPRLSRSLRNCVPSRMRSTVGPSVGSGMTPPGFPAPPRNCFAQLRGNTLPPAVRNHHGIPYGIACHPPILTAWPADLGHICLADTFVWPEFINGLRACVHLLRSLGRAGSQAGVHALHLDARSPPICGFDPRNALGAGRAWTWPRARPARDERPV